MQIKNVLLSVAVLATSVAAEGINCHGSANCDTAPDNGLSLSTLVDIVQGIDDNRWYNDGEQIACEWADFFSGALCVFWQGSNGNTGAETKNYIRALADHGCGRCGSVPYGYPNTNDISNGMLTVNWATNDCLGNGGTGACP
ncbi:hypothetical protein O988_07137 [Pseudogymnoascus sp. VKM F-3808]|nr:hypothetical protein O988_07137 [Pseudogymnoascus sp. VKM F-3808]